MSRSEKRERRLRAEHERKERSMREELRELMREQPKKTKPLTGYQKALQHKRETTKR